MRFSGILDGTGRRELSELIRVAIVEGNNAEVERRRYAERRVERLEKLIPPALMPPKEGSR